MDFREANTEKKGDSCLQKAGNTPGFYMENMGQRWADNVQADSEG